MEDNNFILTGSASRYYWKGQGIFSIKTFENGAAYYNTGKGSFRVYPNTFLLLNSGTNYSIEIEESSKVDSFCLFIDQQTIRETFETRYQAGVYVLDMEEKISPVPCFFERTYPRHFLHETLNTIRNDAVLFRQDVLWLKENLFALLSLIGNFQEKILKKRPVFQI